MIERTGIVLLLALSLLFGEVIDRGNVLSSSELYHLNQLTGAIKENCSVTPLLVYLSEDEQDAMTRISSGYSTELNIRSDQPWILAVLTPSGEVTITIGHLLDSYFSEIHLRSFSYSAELYLAKDKRAQAGEILLLNFAEVIAQKEHLDFGSIFIGTKDDVQTKPHPWRYIAIILLVLVGVSALRVVQVTSRNVRSSSNNTTDEPSSASPFLFGGTVSKTQYSYFGGSLEKKDR